MKISSNNSLVKRNSLENVKSRKTKSENSDMVTLGTSLENLGIDKLAELKSKAESKETGEKKDFISLLNISKKFHKVATGIMIGAAALGIFSATLNPVFAADNYTPEPASIEYVMKDTVRADSLIKADTVIVQQQQQEIDLAKNPMEIGVQGPHVKFFKDYLRHYAKVDSTAVFDEATAEAVKDFQKQVGLKEDGVVGNHTYGVLWNKMFWEKGIDASLDTTVVKNAPENIKIQVSIEKQELSVIDASTGKTYKTYKVSTGTKAHPSPKGDFKITQIIEKPSWYPPASSWAKNAKVAKPGPGNPLGPVKMRLGNSSILIHGTTSGNFSRIGSQASHGCIRMFPHQAWELHNMMSTGVSVQLTN